MIGASEFEIWVKKAYSQLAFYNFEHPGGCGVAITNQSSSPQVLIIAGKIIRAKDKEILVTDDEVLETCKELWGEPKIRFPEFAKKQPILTEINRENLEEVLELICDKRNTKREFSWIIYKVGDKMIKLGKYGIKVERKYLPYCSKDRIKNIMEQIMKDLK